MNPGPPIVAALPKRLTVWYNGRRRKNLNMAMPQRDNYIEELNRLEGLLEYAVEHNDEPEVKRISKEMEKILEQMQ